MSDINDRTEEEPGYFAVIPTTILNDSSLPDGAKLLFARITSLAKARGYAWAKNAYYAKLHATSERTIGTWVRNLREAGYIKVFHEYFPNSKKVKERHIYPVIDPASKRKETHPDLVVKKTSPPDDLVVKKFSPPGGEENFRENNISFNNIKAAADRIEQIPAEIQPEIEKPPEKAAADVFDDDDVEMLKGQFKHLNSKLHFDEAFYPKVLEFLALHKIGFNFVTWMYELCAKKNPRNLSAYLYTVFFEERYVELFREASKPPPEPTISLIRCPACDTEHNELDASCPCCALDKNKRDDFREVFVKKKLLAMSRDEIKAYEGEMNVLLENKSQDFKTQREHIQNIKRKYGLVPPE